MEDKKLLVAMPEAGASKTGWMPAPHLRRLLLAGTGTYVDSRAWKVKDLDLPDTK